MQLSFINRRGYGIKECESKDLWFLSFFYTKWLRVDIKKKERRDSNYHKREFIGFQPLVVYLKISFLLLNQKIY